MTIAITTEQCSYHKRYQYHINPQIFPRLFEGEGVNYKVVFPVHPWTKQNLKKYNIRLPTNGLPTKISDTNCQES